MIYKLLGKLILLSLFTEYGVATGSARYSRPYISSPNTVARLARLISSIIKKNYVSLCFFASSAIFPKTLFTVSYKIVSDPGFVETFIPLMKSSYPYDG